MFYKVRSKDMNYEVIFRVLESDGLIRPESIAIRIGKNSYILYKIQEPLIHISKILEATTKLVYLFTKKELEKDDLEILVYEVKE